MSYRQGLVPTTATSFLSSDTIMVFRNNVPIIGPISALQNVLSVQGTTVVTPPASGSGYASLTDLVWTQPEPYGAVTSGTGDNYRFILGTFAPVGGLGPFSYSMVDPSSTWSIANSNNARTSFATPYPWVIGPGTPGDTTSQIALRVTDATGASVTKTVPVIGGATGPKIVVAANRTWPSNVTPAMLMGVFDASGGQLDASTITLSDPSGLWQIGGISLTSKTYGPVPAGTYPLTLSCSIAGVASRTVTVTVTPAVMSGIAIVSRASVVSTSAPIGWQVLQAAGTSPGNTGVFTLVNAGGKYAIGATTGIVTVVNSSLLSVGPDTFTIVQTEGSVSASYTASVSIVQGSIIDPSAMSMTLYNNFTNYFYRAEYTQRPISAAPPVVSGFPDPAQVKWFISKTERFNWMMDNPKSPLLLEDDDARGGIGRPRFGCNPATGAVVVQCHLSDTTNTPGEWFDLTATDGIRICTKRFYLQVAPAIGPKYYVGPNAAPAGMMKMASLKAALAPLLGWPPETDITAVAGLEIHLEYDPSNPSRYAGDWEPNYNYARRGYNGPFAIVGIPGPNGELPYYGGPRGSSNVSVGDQGLFYCNNGDARFENLELGFQHMGVFGGDYAPASNYTKALIRRCGGCSGDMTIRNVDLHDADIPLESGNTDGHWIIDRVRITNGSGCTSGGGANQHNAYLGMGWKITVTGLQSYNCADGHVVKCRFAEGTWDHCQFYDGERGSQFNALDLCVGGNHTLTYCHFEKGPMAQNPYMIQYGEELPGALPWSIPAQDYINALSFDHCTFTNHATPPIWATGEHGPAAINFVGRIAPNTGIAATLRITNSQFEGYTSSQIAVFSSNLDGGHDFSQNFTQSGNTFSATSFTALTLISPVSKDLGRPGPHDSVADLNHKGNFPYFNARQIDPGVDEIRIASNSAPGTLVCTLHGQGSANWSLSGNPQPDPRIAPFVAGSQWTSGQTLVDYGGASFGYANSKYVFSTLSDGTGEIRVGANGLGLAGLDVVLPRGTSPASTGSIIVENPLFIVKT